MISIIQKPVSFKIRRKSDIKTFKNVCLCNGSKYIIKINPNYIFMLEKTENNIIGTIKQGDLFNIFNPEIQIMWMNGFGNCENILIKNIFRREYYIER